MIYGNIFAEIFLSLLISRSCLKYCQSINAYQFQFQFQLKFLMIVSISTTGSSLKQDLSTFSFKVPLPITITITITTKITITISLSTPVSMLIFKLHLLKGLIVVGNKWRQQQQYGQ